MIYTGKKTKLDWSGRMAAHDGHPICLIEDDSGKVTHMVLSTGGVVPGNWQGRRVRITVEVLPDPPA
jgi:hypothetical protein